MNVPTSSLAALLVVVLAAGARADEGAKQKPTLRPVWKAGTVVTVTEDDADSNSYKVMSPEGKVLDEGDTQTTTTYTRVEKCVEADAAGRPTRLLVHFVEFARVVGKERDESLKGVTVEVTGVGAQRKWKVVGAGVPEDSAKAWLDGDLGPDEHPDLGEVVSPKKDVAVGEVWDLDVKAVGASLGGVMPIDPATVAGTAKLEAVDGDALVSVVELSAQTLGLPNPGGSPFPWSEGGKVTMKLRHAGHADGAAAPVQASAEYELAGKAKTPDGGSADVKIAGKRSHKSQAGGEIPAPPPAPAGPAPDKPGPDKPGPDKPAPDKPAPDKPAPDQPPPAPEKPPTEKQ